MSIVVPCSCGREFRVPDEKAGIRIRCKHCGAVLAVPQAAAGPANESADLAAEPVFDSPQPLTVGKWGRRTGMSPAVKYSVSGGIVVVTVAIVIGILYGRGFFGRKRPPADADNEAELRQPNPRYASQANRRRLPAVKMQILPSSEVKSLDPFELPLHYWVDASNGLNSIKGNVAGTGNDKTLLAVPSSRMKTAPDPNDPLSAARRAAVRKNLGGIAAAFHRYHSDRLRFPTPFQERHGLSWRVHLLPYLGHKALYDRFRLLEPWDSEHNRKLLAEMPPVFATPGCGSGKTTMHVFVGDGAPFGMPQLRIACRIDYQIVGELNRDDVLTFSIQFADRRIVPLRDLWPSVGRVVSFGELEPKGSYVWKLEAGPKAQWLQFRDITDGVDNTLLAAVAGPETATEWTKPGGLPFDPVDPLRVVGTVPGSGLPVVVFSGRVQDLKPTIPAAVFKALITHRGGEAVAL